MSDDRRLREILISRALNHIPKILTLQDRNPHSPTYGCFDRNFWHYKIIDFPSGMAQEFVLPLALAWKFDAPENRFAGQAALLDWVDAGIDFAGRSSHRDGSCDDYYPLEKAAGAAAFSLYAMLRAIEICELDVDRHREFLLRRGRWLAEHRESGVLSNHEALIANGLFRLADLTGDAWLEEAAQSRVDRLLSWQSEEGWFREYDGADPGYLTLTIGTLAEIDILRPGLGLRPKIAEAVAFLASLQPPDGWLGGEWTSRNTHNYFPHGFELIGGWLPDALTVNSRAVASLADGPEYADDHIVAHHCWSYLLAADSWMPDRPDEPEAGLQALRHFPQAGLVVMRRDARTLLAATKKGGAFRYYQGSDLVHADTGISLRIRSGRRIRTAVCHIWARDNRIDLSADAVEISGTMSWAKTQQMTPLKLIVLRCLMMSIGRVKPDLVRRLLQALLITGRSDAPFTFRRRLSWSDEGLAVCDRVEGGDWSKVVAIGAGPAQTSIYTVMSRLWHPSQFQRWTDLTEHVPAAGKGEFEITRTFGP